MAFLLSGAGASTWPTMVAVELTVAPRMRPESCVSEACNDSVLREGEREIVKNAP